MKILSLYIFLHKLSVVRGEVDADPTNPFICSYFDLEELGLSSADKIHMVGYEPLVTEGNEDLLHHLTLYTCEGFATIGGSPPPLDDSNLKHHHVEPACTSMPPGCTNFIAGWAVGANGEAFPEDVGIPIGEGQRWLVMQMHYYNPKMRKDVYDSSGLRVHVTNELRPVDAGIMQFIVGTVAGKPQNIEYIA